MPANGSPVSRLGDSGCPVCQGCAAVFVDPGDVLVAAQATRALAQMRLAPVACLRESSRSGSAQTAPGSRLQQQRRHRRAGGRFGACSDPPLS